jgi:hypothetical protein
MTKHEPESKGGGNDTMHLSGKHLKSHLANDCPVCLVAHDPEIHEATLRVHQWLRDKVTKVRELPIVKRVVGRAWGNQALTSIRRERCSK